MKRLELNPQKFDIVLRAEKLQAEDSLSYGVATVHFTLGDHEGSHCFDRTELEKVGRWFLAVAEKLKQKK